MEVCRTCLACEVDNDIGELQIEDEGSRKNGVEIMQFCLDIEVIQTLLFYLT